MKLVAPILLALLPLPAFAQDAAKLPPANPLEYAPDTDTAGALAAANALLATLAAPDPAAALSAVVHPDGKATAIATLPDGKQDIAVMSWTEFAENIQPDGHRYEERLTDPAVDVDGDVAMVWSPYVFLIDGKLSHCGTDHFDLIRVDGKWKVLNITWNQRKTGCPAL